eukprot:TRINITY_DN38797_c0_g1_i1.p1 TRINITY_DN38797_c0_g1~~TRINITY_DN38797_c0_g1_i1.p1  ORF type:complete len:520 (-),score=75.56 TRINITY_DN38797_c0_g1_i1:150-1709(-)
MPMAAALVLGATSRCRPRFSRGIRVQVVVSPGRSGITRQISFFRRPMTSSAITSTATSSSCSAPVTQKRFATSGPPCEEGQVLELRIDSLTSHGQGLGRLGPTRWVIMVFGALPGELVELRIIRNFKGRSEAKLEQILEESPDRVKPKCSIFERCSGCQYQHLSYDEQLKWKQKHVQDALVRIAGLELTDCEVQETVPSPKQYGYRTKFTPHRQDEPPKRQMRRAGLHLKERHLTEDEWASSSDRPAIGFLEEEWGETRDSTGRRWKQVVDVESCPIATEAINLALTEVRSSQSLKRGSRSLLFRDTTCDSVVTDRQSIVTEEIPGIGSFSFRAGGFFQNNSSILPKFVEHVVNSAVSGASMEDGDSEANLSHHLLDVYCGVGLFAISAARHFQHVTGIELDATAVELARENAERNGVCNASFIALDAAEGLEEVLSMASQSRRTVTIVDPPRQGLMPEARAALLALRPRRLVYVSCDPATQARDLKDMMAAGYKVCHIQPFDLFPQTRHLEVVTVLEC